MLRWFNKDGSYIRKYSTEDYKLILELEQELVKHDIPHVFRELMDGWQVLYFEPDGFRVGDVVQHFGSYGLEAIGFGLEDVKGHLSVEDAFALFQEAHKGVE